MFVLAIPKSSEVELSDLKKELRISILNQMHRLLERKEEIANMAVAVADMSSTDEGVTILESGQRFKHHAKADCEAPCALHSPIDGPWAEWPRQYWRDDDLAGVYRICPHGMAHPAVEQAVYLIKQGKAELLSHQCCDQCVCMPRATLPEHLFAGKKVPVHFNLRDLVEASDAKAPVDNEAQEKEKVYIPNPNHWARLYLENKVRMSVPIEFYILLTSSMMDETNGHYIKAVEDYGSNYHPECVDECDVVVSRNARGVWVTSQSSSWCPVVEIALLAGWKPTKWEEGNDDGDDEEFDD